MKKVWIIIIVAVLMSATVYTVGARFVFYTDSKGFHIVNKNAAQIYADLDAGKFTDIEISSNSTNIELITADDYGFEFLANSAVDTLYSNENGKLTITQSSKSLLFNFSFSGKSDYIKVYIPEKAEMDNVRITNTSGNLTIAKLTSGNLDIKAISGNMEITNIKSAGVQINNTSGNIYINTCKADMLDISIISGQLKAKNLETSGLKVGVTSGNTELAGKLAGVNDIASISGNITLNIQGEKKAYNSNISVVSGDVTVDGNSTKTYEYENAEALNSLKINSTSGNVTVNYKGQ